MICLFPIKLSIRHNSLILKDKCTFVWCSYHFNTPFCVFLQYSQSKREILCQKEKQYSVKLHHFFFRILCRIDIYFKRLIVYQSVITMNISNTYSVTVLSNLQFNITFSVLKKSCKNEYICSSDICLSNIITSSRISLITSP